MPNHTRVARPSHRISPLCDIEPNRPAQHETEANGKPRAKRGAPVAEDTLTI